MYASVRRYVVPAPVVEALARRTPEIESVIGHVPGCSGGQFIRTVDGLIVVMVGADEPVVMEAGRRFAAWTRRNLPAFRTASPPDVWTGELVTHDAQPKSGGLVR